MELSGRYAIVLMMKSLPINIGLSWDVRERYWSLVMKSNVNHVPSKSQEDSQRRQKGNWWRMLKLHSFSTRTMLTKSPWWQLLPNDSREISISTHLASLFLNLNELHVNLSELQKESRPMRWFLLFDVATYIHQGGRWEKSNLDF